MESRASVLIACVALPSLQMGKKLLYRSKQRGFLELDLLVGLWAEREVPNMDMQSMNQFSTLLDQVSSWVTTHLCRCSAAFFTVD